jgi:hypothetical protein
MNFGKNQAIKSIKAETFEFLAKDYDGTLNKRMIKNDWFRYNAEKKNLIGVCTSTEAGRSEN